MTTNQFLNHYNLREFLLPGTSKPAIQELAKDKSPPQGMNISEIGS